MSTQCFAAVTPHSNIKPRMSLMQLHGRSQACRKLECASGMTRRNLWSDSVEASTTRKLRVQPVSERRRQLYETRNTAKRSRPQTQQVQWMTAHCETLVRGNESSLRPSTSVRLMTGSRALAPATRLTVRFSDGCLFAASCFVQCYIESRSCDD